MKTKFNNIKQLSDKKILEGMKHCFDNSNNLFKSATTLKRNKKYGVATSILTLSIEELMKSLALFNLLVSDNDEKESVKDIFESKDLHGSRLDFALFMNEYFKAVNLKKAMKSEIEINTPEELSRFLAKRINFEQLFKNIEKEKKTFNNWFDQANERKNAGLYVAYNNKWFTPNRITEKDFIKALNETKLIRNNVTIILELVLSLDENNLDVFTTFMKQFKTHFASETGIEQAIQLAISETEK